MGLSILTVFSFSKSLQKQEEKLNSSSKSDVTNKQKTSSLKINNSAQVNNVVVDAQPSESSRTNLKQDLNDENPIELSQDKDDKSTITEEEAKQQS